VDHELTPENFAALAKIVGAMKADVARIEHDVYGGPKGNSLKFVGEQTREAIRDLTVEYRADRHNAVLYLKQRLEPQMRQMTIIACVMSLIAIGMCVTVLVRGNGPPPPTLIAHGR
jgi:hypothetical protein